MVHSYLDEVLNAMGEILRLDLTDLGVRLALLGNLAGALGFKSIHDLARTADFPKDRLYRSMEEINQMTCLQAVRRYGRRRLIRHLRFLRRASPATRSRGRVTLAGDDFTSRRRGCLDGLTYFWWNGGQKRITLGLSIQVLAAIIGDGDDVIIIDVRLVVPPHDGPGAPPAKKTDWMAMAIDRLRRDLERAGLDFSQCVGSVDQAYLSPSLLEVAEAADLPLVSTMPMQRRMSGAIGPVFRFAGSAAFCHAWWLRIEGVSLRRMAGEPGLHYLRKIVDVPSIGEVVLINARKDGEDAVLFSTETSMKTVTIVRAARRRWHLEKVFWNLQQNLGIGSVRHTDRFKILARIHFLLILHSAVRRTAKRCRETFGEICRNLHRHRMSIIRQLCSDSGLSDPRPRESVPKLGLAA